MAWIWAHTPLEQSSTSQTDQDLQQKTYLDKTWNQKSEIRQVGIIEAMNFRLDASYQLDANNSIGANFGFLRNPSKHGTAI